MIYLSLGSNIGNRLINLQTAIQELEDKFFTKLNKTIVYETKALQLDSFKPEWDLNFLNMVVYGECDVTPENLLKHIKHIEQKMGRDLNSPSWSPRIIDIDILYFNNISLKTSDLVIPHPRIDKKPFLRNLLHLAGIHDFEYTPDTFINTMTVDPKLCAVVNVTPDSFSDGGDCIDCEKAIEAVEVAYHNGATVIELGGQSTRPGYIRISAEQEWSRIKNVFQCINNNNKFNNKYKNVIGVDTFYDEVALKSMESMDLFWLNNVYANYSQETLEKIAEKNIKLVYMYDSSSDLMTWANVTINFLLKHNIKLENIILDPGVGFGKKIYENIKYIKIAKNLKTLGCDVLIGHSRKSFMKILSNDVKKDLDIETLAVSSFLHDESIDYLRIHDTKKHMKFFTAKQCFSQS